MSTLAPPPVSPTPDAALVDPEALIEEARLRHRRRRRRRAAVIVAMALAVTAALVLRDRSKVAPNVIRVPGGPTVNIRAFAGQGRLAFVSGNAAWVLDGDKTLRKILTPAGVHPFQPSFSRDGRWLAFIDTRTPPADAVGGAASIGQLWLAHGDGTGARPVAGLADAQLVGWSPRADVVAVVAGPISKQIPFGVETTVRLVSPNGNARRLISARYIRGAVWSPHGQQLAVVTEDTRLHDVLATYPVNGSDPTVWARFGPQTHLNGMTQILANPVGWWDGFGIGVWVYGDGMTRNNDATPIDVVASPGSKARFLAATLSDGTTRVVAAARKRLAVVADVSHGINGGRVVWDAKQVRICMSAGCRSLNRDRRWVTLDPAWSPGGGLLAYVAAPDRTSGGWQQSVLENWYADHLLRVFDVRTKRTRTVATARGATVPIWARDGTSLLFVDRDGIWLLPRLDSKPVAIATPLFKGAWPSYFGQMAWSAQFGWSRG